MEFSMRSFAVVSLLLLLSMSTDVGGPFAVDAIYCPPWDRCRVYCWLLGLPGCCSLGISVPCSCGAVFCPLITENEMAGATDKELFLIKERVIA